MIGNDGLSTTLSEELGLVLRLLAAAAVGIMMLVVAFSGSDVFTRVISGLRPFQKRNGQER
jgi:hypothetical protein